MVAPVRVVLRKGIARSLAGGHPWVYRDALVDSGAEPGSEVQVVDDRGRNVARGLAEAGPIAVRVFSTRNEPFGPQLLAGRMDAALALRERAAPSDTDAYRLLHGEGDRLPGIVCDRYADYAVLKLDGAALPTRQDEVVEALWPRLQALGIRGLLLRLTSRKPVPPRLLQGESPPEEIEVQERGMRMLANLWRGQKTGLFLDHRESRARVRQLSDGLRVLNLYGYTGGFSVAAALGGATSVVTVDVAAAALELATRTLEANDLDVPHEAVAMDVPEFLQQAKTQGRRFDLIVADPPNFAPNESSVPAALRSYRALHRACLSLLDVGGFYVAASCSSHVRSDAFLQSMREGAGARTLQVLEQTGAPFDHPRLLGFPEGDYLKVVFTRAH